MSRNAPQFPNNYATSAIAAVSTATGFSAGDLVYYQNNDYVSPTVTPSAFANPSGSLTFAALGTTPTPSNHITAGGPVSPVFYGTSVSGYGIGGGTGAKGSSAVLTSGNIVQVWKQGYNFTNAGQYYFQIVTPAGSLVVAPTSISATYTGDTSAYSNICVTALSGGGFALLFVNASGGTTNKPTYAIYTNTGSVTVGALNDTSFSAVTTRSYLPAIIGLPDGGFVMSVVTTSNAIQTKIVSATGVVIQAWTARGFTTYGANTLPPALAARSNSEFILAYPSGANSIAYAIYNASGTAIVGLSTMPTTAVTFTSGYPLDAGTLADGTTFILAYAGARYSSGNGSAAAWTPIPSGNVLGTELQIPPANLNQTGGAYPKTINVLPLASGGYVIATADGSQQMKYVFYNAAGTAQSGTNGSGALPLVVQNVMIPIDTKVTLLELSSTIVFYLSGAQQSSATVNTYTFSVDKTTYAVTYPATASNPYGYVTTTAASTVSVANSTATAFKYLLNAPETQTVASRMPSTLSPTTISSSSCLCLSSCTLTTGKYAFAYVTTAGVVSVNIYSSAGVFEQTISVDTSTTVAAAEYVSSFKIVALADGKFAIYYPYAGSYGYLCVYSAAFAQTAKQSFYPSGTFSAQQNIAIAALSTDQIVVFSPNQTGTDQIKVFSTSDLATAVWSGQLPIGAAVTNGTIIGNNYGGFAIGYYYSTNTASYVIVFAQTGATTWVSTTANAVQPGGAAGSSICGSQRLYYNGAGVYGIVNPANNSAQTRFSAFDDNGAAIYYSGTFTTANSQTYQVVSIGQNGYGNAVIVTDAGVGSGLNFYAAAPAGTIGSSSSTTFMNFPAVGYSSVTLANGASTRGNASAGSCPSISPAYGNYCTIGWINALAQPVFAIVNCYPLDGSYTVSTSQLPSTPVSVPTTPVTIPSTTAISGTFLAGVAATTATAGGTGQLVINGLAQLNSSYPTTTNQYVDSTGLAVGGVKGTIKGRVANFQGN